MPDPLIITSGGVACRIRCANDDLARGIADGADLQRRRVVKEAVERVLRLAAIFRLRVRGRVQDPRGRTT
jgi:hypothetical protein